MDKELNAEDLSTGSASRAVQQTSSPEAGEFDALLRKGLNLRPLVRSVIRNIWLVAGVATVISSFAAMRSMSQPPIYAGSFQLLVEPLNNEARIADPLTLTRAEGRVPNRDAFGLDYPTQIAVLRSPGMLESIAERVRKEYPDFNAGTLASGLNVARLGTTVVESTKIIEVGFTASNPELVKLVLEKTAERYLEYSLEDRKTRFSEGIKFIEDQLPRLQERVDTLQNELQALQEQYALISPNAQGEQLSGQMNQISTADRETRQQLREQITLYNTLRRQLALTPEEAIAASALSEEPGYRQLQQQMQDIERQLAVESARFSEESPIIQNLRARQQNLSSLMSQEAQRILGQNLGRSTGNPQVMSFQNSVRMSLIEQMVATANQIRVLQARSDEIALSRGQLQTQFQRFPVLSRRYNDIVRQLEIATRNLDLFQSQRETLRIESAQTEVPWELMSPPGDAITIPQNNRTVLVMMVGSVILGIIAAIMLDKLRNIFHTTEDVQDAIELPLLGVVPFDRSAGDLQEDTLLPMVGEGETRIKVNLFQESFSALYASISFLSEGNPVRSLAICSAAPGEGKTVIALHLAYTIASMGKRVLLVDSNLRYPQIGDRLDLLSQKGLSDILLDNLDPEPFIQPSICSNLFVLPAGQPSLGAIRLLASKHMETTMAKLHQSFDLVIYDTPHLLGLTDAEFLAANTQGIVMVVGVRKVKRSVALQVMQQLSTYRMQSLGVVANHPRRRSLASFGYYLLRQRPPQRRSQPTKNTFRFRLKAKP